MPPHNQRFARPKIEGKIEFKRALHKSELNQKIDGWIKRLKKYRGHPRFYELLEELKELHGRKNADYSKEEDSLS